MLINLLGPESAEFYLSLIDNQELFIEKTAYELLWGYNDPLLQLLVLLGLTDDPLMKIEVNTIVHTAIICSKTIKYQYAVYDTFVVIILCPYASVIIN